MIAYLLNLAALVFAGTVGGIVAALFLLGLPWAAWEAATSAIDAWTGAGDGLPDRPSAVLYAFVAWCVGNMAVILWLAFLDWVLS